MRRSTRCNRKKPYSGYRRCFILGDPELKDGHCLYTLLLSPRVEELICRAGIDLNARIRVALPDAPLSDIPLDVDCTAGVVGDLAAANLVPPDTPVSQPQTAEELPKPQPHEAKDLRPAGDLFSRPFYIEDLRELAGQAQILTRLIDDMKQG